MIAEFKTGISYCNMAVIETGRLIAHKNAGKYGTVGMVSFTPRILEQERREAAQINGYFDNLRREVSLMPDAKYSFENLSNHPRWKEVNECPDFSDPELIRAWK